MNLKCKINLIMETEGNIYWHLFHMAIVWKDTVTSYSFMTEFKYQTYSELLVYAKLNIQPNTNGHKWCIFPHI